jgi:hypothetical protein
LAAPNPVSLLDTPSYDIPMNWSRSPLISVPRKAFQPGASRALVSTTPGMPCSSPRKSRPRSCVSLISSARITPARSPLWVRARSAAASTVMTSSRPPTSRTIGGTDTRSVAESTMPRSS